MKDIVAVWGNDPTMRYLVSEWGEEVFRASALHNLAIDEANRQRERAKNQSADAKKGKKK